MKKKNLLLLFLFMCFCTQGQLKLLYNQSVEAYKSKDYALFLKLNKQMDSIRPSHPTVMYNLAAAYSLNQMEKESVAALEKLVLMDNSVVFEQDADFGFIKDSDGFRSVKELKTSQEKTIVTSVEKLSLSEKDLHPETVLYLDKHKLWLASSIRSKKIVSFDSKGNCTDWFTDVPYSVFALKADEKQQFLWVSASAMPVMKGFTADLDGQNQILKIDIKSRKIVKSYAMQGKHVFGDLILARDGSVYVSDSMEPLIYKIANDNMVVWKDLKNDAYNLQGLAFNTDGSRLFVADYVKGILCISMKENSASWMAFPQGATTKGIDGLVFYKNTLVAIHNGAIPIRIVQYRLNAQNDRITASSVLDNNREIFNEPALATISKGKLYFFANSPWKFYDAANNLDLSKFQSPKLFELDLKLLE